MTRLPLTLDERNLRVIQRVSSTMYCVTLLSLVCVAIYRQFVLHQAVGEFEDIAVIITANVLVLSGAVVYFGGVSVGRIRPFRMLAFYVGFVLIGFLSTLLKYQVLLDQPLGPGETLNKLLIVSVICGLMVLGFMAFAYLGNRRIEKKLK